MYDDETTFEPMQRGGRMRAGKGDRSRSKAAKQRAQERRLARTLKAEQ